jgi:DNA-binding IclR family transcriptional regulator
MTTEVSGKAPESERKFVEALARGLEVLAAFRNGERFLGNQEIAKRTRLPKSTVSRLTYTLAELGYLASAENNKYRLGRQMTTLGYSMLARMDIRRIARPLMQALAEHTLASVNMGTRDGLNMIYVDTYRNTSTFTVQLDVGSQISIATTSMGRAYLCALPDEERGELLKEIRGNNEQNWTAIEEGMEKALATFRERGYCMSLGNWRSEVHAIAAPLVLDDSTIMVFSCSGAAFQMPQQLLENEIGPRLLNLVGNVRTALAFARS